MPTAGWGSANSPDHLLPLYPFGEPLGQVSLHAHSTEGIRAEQGHGAHRVGGVEEKLGERAKVIKLRARVKPAQPGSKGGVCAGAWRSESRPPWGTE